MTRYFDRREQVNAAVGPKDGVPPGSLEARTPFFRRRWSKLGTNPDGTLQGAWTKFFLANTDPRNPRQDLRIYNTFNRTDTVVQINGSMLQLPSKFPAWLMAQVVGKPFGPLGLGGVDDLVTAYINSRGATDNVDEQRWWTLAIDGRPSAWRTTQGDAVNDQNGVWAGAVPHGGTPTDMRTRQWAEVAIWYPALAPAAGAWPVGTLDGQSLTGVDPRGFPTQGRNIDFTTMGGSEGATSAGSVSHSYLYIKKLRDVWWGYQVLRDIFKQGAQ